MKKRTWLILICSIVIILVGFIIWFLMEKKSLVSIISPLSNQITPTVTQILKTWEDPAGFKFSYPEGISINDHQEDTENYAHLELTNSFYPGRILIWMKDKTNNTLEEWVLKQTGEPQVFDSELAGQSAKKLAFTSPKKLIIAAFDQEVLILIEVYPENEWWTKTYEQILDSFELTSLLGKDKVKSRAPGAWQGQTGDSGIIDEGEEVVE